MSICSTRSVGAIVAGLALAIGSATSLEAEAGTGGAKTERMSVSSRGTQGNRHTPPVPRGSDVLSISRNGRLVAFTSKATNLILRDTNRRADIFVRDRKEGTTRRVSVSSRGTQPDKGSSSPSISADGRFVAFRSYATNLVPGDTNGAADVFVRDRTTGRTRRVSVGSGGTQARKQSFSPVISAGGRFVAFRTKARLSGADTNRMFDVYVHDRTTGETSVVSVSSDGVQADGYSGSPSISADGRVVAFTSYATNLVQGDTNEAGDVFIHDRETGKTTRVSVDSSGGQADGHSSGPSLSADGRFVAFDSDATNLVAGDTNRRCPSADESCPPQRRGTDAFVHDQVTGKTARVSVSSAGDQGNKASLRPSISANGRFVTFISYAKSLVSDDTNRRPDIFVRDRKAATTRRVSVSARGTQAEKGSSSPPSISADGRFVAFYSRAWNLVKRDTNRSSDAFAHGPLRRRAFELQAKHAG